MLRQTIDRNVGRGSMGAAMAAVVQEEFVVLGALFF